MSAWQVLHLAGLPLAGPRQGPAPTVRDVADAVRTAMSEHLGAGRERDALCAFLLAWRHEWPTSYRAAFDNDADRVGRWAVAHVGDANRYLKLRRIALANLATLL